MGDFIAVRIYSFDNKGIVLETMSCEFYLRRNNSNFGYEVVARVFNVEDRLLEIGSILIELDINLQGGIRIQDRVKFNFERLDLF